MKVMCLIPWMMANGSYSAVGHVYVVDDTVGDSLCITRRASLWRAPRETKRPTREVKAVIVSRRLKPDGGAITTIAFTPISLASAGFGLRAVKALNRAGIKTITGLRLCYEAGDDFTLLKGIGDATAEQIYNYFRVTDSMR